MANQSTHLEDCPDCRRRLSCPPGEEVEADTVCSPYQASLPALVVGGSVASGFRNDPYSHFLVGVLTPGQCTSVILNHFNLLTEAFPPVGFG